MMDAFTDNEQKGRCAMGAMQRWIAGAALMALAACGPAPEPGSIPRSGGSRVISGEEIQAATASNLFDVVQRLRPGWIQERAGAGGRGYPAVYVGSQRHGGVERLREFDTSNVLEVRFFNAAEASSRFGRGVPYGVIQVMLDIGG
jgi:hypothetical protein